MPSAPSPKIMRLDLLRIAIIDTNIFQHETGRIRKRPDPGQCMDGCPEAKQGATGCNPDHVALKSSSDCEIQYHSRFLFSAFTCNLVTNLGSETIYHFASNIWTTPQMDAIPDPDNMPVPELENFCDAPLQAAAYKGDTERIRELIEARADPNTVSGFFGTALQAACYRGHYHVSVMLLMAGAITKPSSGYYGNPVQAAACGGHAELIGLLIRVGADINAKGGVYGNALVGAAKWGHEVAVIELTENGAKLNAEGSRDYSTALYAASLHGHWEVVARLLHCGADPNKDYGDGKFALLAAVQGAHKEVVSLLIKYGASLDEKCDGGLNVGELTLHMAVEGGHTLLVRMLLKWPCIDANSPNKEGLSPLLMAVSQGHIDIVRAVLDYSHTGIDLEARDRSGSTALMIAVSHGYLDVVRLLLTHDEERGNTNVYGQKSKSLMMAVSGGNQDLVALLLEFGAKPGRSNQPDQTPLMTAIDMRHEAITFLLLQHGANIDADSSGNKPIEVAISKGYRTIENLLNFGEGEKAIAERDRWWKTVSRVRDDDWDGVIEKDGA